jgi:vitamin K-dependent gamma-carboxylase
VNWTEEGHRFSWRMKLRDKTGLTKFFIVDQQTNYTQEINQDTLLSSRQQQKVSCRPELIHMFAHEIANIYQRKYNKRPKVTAQALCSLNYRPYQHMVKPGFDLASTPLW